MFETLLKSVDNINDYLGRWASYGVVPITFLVMYEVCSRYLFNAPTVWANELTQMIFGVYVMLSGGYIMRWGGHVNVDIIYSRLSDRSKALMDIATSFLFFVFVGMMAWFGGSLAWESVQILELSESAWSPPIWPVKLMIPLGAVLLLLQGIANLIRNIMFVTTGAKISLAVDGEKETL